MSRHIPSPEEMQMMESMRRLRQMGHAEDAIDKLYMSRNPTDLLPAPKKEPDERKDTKVKEAPFPGEFSVMRISG